MNTRKLWVIAALLGAHPLANAAAITVKGSDTLVILAQKWAEVYMSSHPTAKIQVTGGGSGIGFAALQNKTTDIADASRPIKPAERAACIKSFGKKPRGDKGGLEGLPGYVKAGKPLTDPSVGQPERTFNGKAK